MEYLRGPLYLDIASKGLCLAGVVLMIFGQGGWFAVGVFAVVIGVLFGAWSMVAARRMRRRERDGVDPV
jgi:drug/metabolite transporter (DMT)-like permease